MAVTILDFPTGIPVDKVTMFPTDAVGANESPFTLRREVQHWGGQRWGARLDFLPLTPSEAAIMRGFALSMFGGLHLFRMGDYTASEPRNGGTVGGSPTVTGGTPGTDTLGITGLSGQLSVGDYIQVGDDLYCLTANGTTSLKVWPWVRKTYSVGAAVIVRNARGVFSLASRHVFETDRMQRMSFSLEAVEDFRR